MNDHDYRAAPGINATAIVAGMTSMLHMRHVMTGGERPDTPAMAWGRKVHKAVLEPLRFFDELAIWDGGRRAGREWAEFEAAHPDRDTHATADELAALSAISAAFWRCRPAADIMDGAETERVITWQQAGYGAGKARLDVLRCRDVDRGVYPPILADYKTTRNIAPSAFFATAYRLAYHVRMGWYAHGVETLTGQRPHVYLIVQESAPPYDCWVARMSDAIVQTGMDDAVEIARQYRAHEVCGSFPGVAADGLPIDFELPAWVGGDGAAPDMEGCDSE